MLKQIEDLHASPRQQCSHFFLPVHEAAKYGSWKALETLLLSSAKFGCKVEEMMNFSDSEGNQAIHWAVQSGNVESVQLYEETTMSLLPILDIQDKHGHTALHIATKNGHVPTVRILLKMGSNVTVKNVEGENVFQIACRFGRTKLIQMIVDHAQFAAVLNRTNHRGWTPFHVAAKEGNITVIQVLMKKGAFLRKDYEGRTPLHLAAENGHKEVVSLILNTHSHLIDITDNYGNSALHSATINNEPKVADLLLRLKCQLTYNNDGCSAVDLALINKFAEVALVMVTHKTRGDEVLGLVEGKFPCIMEALIAKMPGVARAVLDTGIKKSTSEKPDSAAFYVEYDFKWLALPGDIDKLKSSAFLPILNNMVMHNRVSLLSHELSLKYMEMKWKAYGKYFQFTNLLFYMLYLLVVTWVATNEMERDFKFYVRFKWFNESEEACLGKNESSMSCEMPTIVGRGEREVEAFRSYRNATQNYDQRQFLKVKIWLIALVAVINLLLELVSMCRHGIKYCNTIDTWVWIAMNINCVIATSFQIQARQFKADEAAISYDLVNPSLANAVFMGWFYLFIMMQRFGAVGLYVSMFLEIVKTLLRVLLVFSALIIAFALAFYVLLSNGNHVAFSNFPMSLMTTLMWLMGDWEFVSTLLFPYQCEEMERANITNTRLYSTLDECKLPRRVPHPYVTFGTICIFLVFMPIVMMNLMIGLAVGDIESVRKNAQLKRLSMQVQSHISIEKSLPPFLLRKLDKTSVVEYPNARKYSMVADCFSKFFPSEPEKDEGDDVDIESDDLMEAILDNNVTLSQITSDIEQLKAMVKLMCTKLSINNEMQDEDELIPKDSPPMSSLRKDWQRHLSRRVRRKPSTQRCHSSALLLFPQTHL
ncbi:unnamed protein product [Allacma fusca]|uniref:Ion transport domain-containing protein n=1 Tax=Allacma fusca TaxID=39272 RepID=A0A8J2PFB1_9HEXA|nr:unnamed protein product [Allacma fusca]